MPVSAAILFLRPDQILYNQSARWPQTCIPDTIEALGPCADGQLRDEIFVPIADDARAHSLFESGFEVVKLRPPGVVSMLERLRREGLSGAESPGAAVANSPLQVLASMLSSEPAAADTAIARALEGSSAYSLRGALFTAHLRCSGLIVRRSGPKLAAPVDFFNSWDGSGDAHLSAAAKAGVGTGWYSNQLFEQTKTAAAAAIGSQEGGAARDAEGGGGGNGGEYTDLEAWPEPLDHSGDTRLPAYTPHVDQDVRGEPLTSMGLSWLFASVPFVRLLNVWLPFGPVPVRPLALMDVRSLKRTDDLVLYRASFKINASKPTDVLLLRHGAQQRWHFDSAIDAGEALVFDAAATPHASFEAPSEVILAELRHAILAWLKSPPPIAGSKTPAAATAPAAAAFELAWRQACEHAARPVPTQPGDFQSALIGRLLEDSHRLLHEVCASRGQLVGAERLALAERARDVLRRSERLSLEMRCAAIVVPRAALPAVAAALTGLAAAVVATAGVLRRSCVRRRARKSLERATASEVTERKQK